jgi:recombinational DNA repair protein RecT
MASYDKLRELISHRVTLDYDTGAKIVGYVATCKPGFGTVQLLVLSRAQIYDDKGKMLEQHDELSVVPNVMTSFRLTEGPA